ncbi:hypothetical protein P3X46_012560 [Hevea brasiliensis]|uniref:FRIGIDA-like protein n=1 Tax=Hevea brasiliensis TaxID=3981 RepID=A0ABQ9MCX4_HEVBR|nr:hypothetical protein P3X46_012560 [Hevea brasiliensis]
MAVDELSVALENANAPARLVLDSLEAFYPPLETTQPMVKRNAALHGMQKSCIMFMEALAALLARIDPGADHLPNLKIKQQAKVIADEWKPKLASAGVVAANGNSLEAYAFLQLLSTFRIASEFDEELCKLVLVVAHRRQAPELCCSLGLTHKKPGVIESLINCGKQTEAVRFIHAFQLAESFPPVHLLKTYLKDFRRNSQGKGGNTDGATGQGNVNAQELPTLKAIIRCVEEYKLEADYPLNPLRKRVAQLILANISNQNGECGFCGVAPPGPTVGRPAPLVFAERIPYTRMQERYPHGGPNPYNYQVPAQSGYGQPGTDQRACYYPQDDRLLPGLIMQLVPITAVTWIMEGSYMNNRKCTSHTCKS